MRTFSYEDNDAYNAEKERRERWNNASLPVVFLVLFGICWVLYINAMIAISKNSLVLQGYVEGRGIVTENGITYSVPNMNGIVYDFTVKNTYGYDVGETVTVYYHQFNPNHVDIANKYPDEQELKDKRDENDDTWIWAFPLAVLTIADILWLLKVMIPKKKHYIPQEEKAQ